jgi:hypothetical protein
MIVRVEKNKDNPYVMMNKAGLNDPYLSFKAKGILAYLLSKPDKWQVYVSDLAKHAADGASAIRTGLRELKKQGYADYERPRKENGKFTSGGWTIFEVPRTRKPHIENPHVDNPGVENHPLVINDSSDNDSNDKGLNTGADAPAQPEPVQEPKPKKATGKNALKAELIDFFVEATGLPMPPLNNGGQRKAAGATWFSPVLEVAGWCDGDPDECKAIIGAAITRLRKINYTISSPKSILNVARAVYAERNGNGKTHVPALSAAGTHGPVPCAAGLGDVICADDFTDEELGRCST